MEEYKYEQERNDGQENSAETEVCESVGGLNQFQIKELRNAIRQARES